LIESGFSPWKARAALLTLSGLLLTVAGFWGIFASGWMLLVVSALVMGAFESWSTILYTAVADTLPARGVAIGTAIGAVVLELAMLLFGFLIGSLRNDYGAGLTFGVSAALAAAGLLCIGLLAWLVHPKATILPTPSGETV
jgi:hypothetical protein